MPPIDKFEAWQDLISQVFAENIGFDPEAVQRFFVNNLVQRTLAHLVGQGKNKGIPIRATEAGALVVAGTGLAIEDNETVAGTVVATAEDPVEFSHVCSVVEVWTWDFECYFRRSPDGVRWGGWIELRADMMYPYDASTKNIEIKNKDTDGSHDTRYQIVGWY